MSAAQKSTEPTSESKKASANLPAYEPPKLTLMKEEELLSAFQVPVVATTWWVM